MTVETRDVVRFLRDVEAFRKGDMAIVTEALPNIGIIKCRPQNDDPRPPAALQWANRRRKTVRVKVRVGSS